MRVLVAIVAAAWWLAAPCEAQPMPERGADPRVGGATQMPVTITGETEVLGAEGTGSSSPPPVVSVDEPIDPAKYICGPGDVFELNFWGPQNFRLRISADLEGRAFVSKVGFVKVVGKTLLAVRDEVHKKVRRNYPGLNFELTLATPRTFLVHVVDNVGKPGAYIAHPLERVSAVIARSGGITEAGSRRKIRVRHKVSGESTADLTRYEQTGDLATNPLVLDGDVITVPSAETVVTVEGAVNRPGKYELVATKDVTELLQLAGGVSGSIARTLPLRIIRRNEAQHAVATELKFSGETMPNAPLHDRDTVQVRSVDELQRTVLLIGAVVGADPLDTATASKRLPYVEGDTALSLITRAGGIQAQGDLKRAYISRSDKTGTATLLALDLEALLVRRDFSADKAVQLGDTIVVPPTQHSILVEGAIARPGMYPYNPRFGFREYVAIAGGRTRTARDLDEAVRIDRDGVTHPYGGKTRLVPGDAILVPERTFSRPEIVQLVIAGAGLVLSAVALTLAVR